MIKLKAAQLPSYQKFIKYFRNWFANWVLNISLQFKAYQLIGTIDQN